MTQLVKFVALASVGIALVSCSNVETESREGQYCSRDRNESPQYVCDLTTTDLICIATYRKGPTDAYVCRRACTTNSECGSDVCCAGMAVANAFNATRGCVPRSLCQTDPAALVTPDASLPDPRDGSAAEVGADVAEAQEEDASLAGGDASGADGAADAP